MHQNLVLRLRLELRVLPLELEQLLVLQMHSMTVVLERFQKGLLELVQMNSLAAVSGPLHQRH